MEHGRSRGEEIGQQGDQIYQQGIRAKVETPENIGKMVIIDIDTGDYEVGDEMGIDAAKRLYARHPGATLYGIRIGYNVAAALGGVMERTGS